MRRRVDPTGEAAHDDETQSGEIRSEVLGERMAVGRRRARSNHGDRPREDRQSRATHVETRRRVAKVAQAGGILGVARLEDARQGAELAEAIEERRREAVGVTG